MTGDLTSESIDRYASTIRRMQQYAKRTEHRDLIAHTDKLKRYI